MNEKDEEITLLKQQIKTSKRNAKAKHTDIIAANMEAMSAREHVLRLQEEMSSYQLAADEKEEITMMRLADIRDDLQRVQRQLSEKVVELEVVSYSERALREELATLRHSQDHQRAMAMTADEALSGGGPGDAGRNSSKSTGKGSGPGIGTDDALELRLLQEDLREGNRLMSQSGRGGSQDALDSGGGVIQMNPACTEGGDVGDVGTSRQALVAQASSSSSSGPVFDRGGESDRPPESDHEQMTLASLVTHQLERCRGMLMDKERELVAAVARHNEERDRSRQEACRAIAAASSIGQEMSHRLNDTQRLLETARLEVCTLKDTMLQQTTTAAADVAELTRQLADMKAEVEAKETALIDQTG